MFNYLKVVSMLVLSLIFVATPFHVSAQDDLELAKKSGCLGCHSVDKKLAGPALMDVSKKYKGEKKATAILADGKAVDGSPKEVLIEKVKKGGKGNWTKESNGMSMPANSPRVSDADIAKLVDFILDLAK